MNKSAEKSDNSLLLNRDKYLVNLVNTESETINESWAIIREITKKHNITNIQLLELLHKKEKYAAVPIGIFRSSLSPLECLVRYLKDVFGYTFSDIAKLLLRDETTIWTTYQNSLEKGKIVIDLEMNEIDFSKLKLKKSELVIPVTVFTDRRLSVLESLCLYLKEEFGLRYHTIALLLDRDDRTIWTVVNRARKKLE